MQVDVEPEELASGARVSIGIVADAAAAAEQLHDALEGRTLSASSASWLTSLQDALDAIYQDTLEHYHGDAVTPEAINFMARFGRGLICVAMTSERCDELDLPLMVEKNTSAHETAFTVSVEATKNTTTGISAHDRAETVRVLSDPTAGPEDLRRPGHMFPLRARRGGVLKRAGHTETGVDMARMAGLTPAAEADR